MRYVQLSKWDDGRIDIAGKLIFTLWKSRYHILKKHRVHPYESAYNRKIKTELEMSNGLPEILIARTRDARILFNYTKDKAFNSFLLCIVVS